MSAHYWFNFRGFLFNPLQDHPVDKDFGIPLCFIHALTSPAVQDRCWKSWTSFLFGDVLCDVNGGDELKDRAAAFSHGMLCVQSSETTVMHELHFF